MKIGDTKRTLHYVQDCLLPVGLKVGEDNREVFNTKDYNSRAVKVSILTARYLEAAWLFSHYEKPTPEELKPITDKLQASEDKIKRKEERKRTHWFFGLIKRYKPLSLPQAKTLQRKAG